MLSYDAALGRILDVSPAPLSGEEVPLAALRGRALADDVIAETAIPPFDNSAVDGFAVRCEDTVGAGTTNPITLPVTQTIAAGYAPAPIGTGEAARIMTGAVVPPGADGIVMVEDTTMAVDGGRVALHAPGSGRHIRRAGSDVPAGARVLRAGETLDAGSIGVLASLNKTSILCVRRPRVALITTGDELVPVGGAALQPGRIRDSNGPALAAAIEEAGGTVTVRLHARDTAEDVRAAFDRCRECDVVVCTGGVSVGEFDFVKAVVEERGALDFWRIAIKPGKPLAFGSINDTPFFGLPGNPVSSLVTFELFVRPLLRKLGGHATVTRPVISAVLTAPLPHAAGRREFARASLTWSDEGCHATPTGHQGSHRLSSLIGADAYLIAHEDHADYDAGERLPALLLR